jgi:hypothetical protein
MRRRLEQAAEIIEVFLFFIGIAAVQVIVAVLLDMIWRPLRIAYMVIWAIYIIITIWKLLLKK